jgi:predicted ATPase
MNLRPASSSNPAKYVITGGPGFGKTSIIEALETRGYASMPEISRSIIREQLDAGGDVLPWKNLETFSRLVFEKRIYQYHQAPENVPVFFDRGVPDVVAYMVKDALELPSVYAKALHEITYNQKVFVTPPWEAIFVNDAERKEQFSDACLIHQFITDTYQGLGYQVIEIPLVSVDDRVSFILSQLPA